MQAGGSQDVLFFFLSAAPDANTCAARPPEHFCRLQASRPLDATSCEITQQELILEVGDLFFSIRSGHPGSPRILGTTGYLREDTEKESCRSRRRKGRTWGSHNMASKWPCNAGLLRMLPITCGIPRQSSLMVPICKYPNGVSNESRGKERTKDEHRRLI